MCASKHASPNRLRLLPFLLGLGWVLSAAAGGLSWQQQFDAGLRARTDGDITESIEWLQAAVQQAPDAASRGGALLQLARSLEQAGRLADADAALLRADSLAGEDARLSIALARGNIALREHDAATARGYYQQVAGSTSRSQSAQPIELAAQLNLARLDGTAARVETLQRLLPRLAQLPEAADRARALCALGVLARESAGGQALAELALTRSLDAARQARALTLEIECDDARAQLYESQGRAALALQDDHAALTLAATRPLGQVEPLLVRLYWREARLERARGEGAAALAAALQAARHAEAIRQDLPIEDESGRSSYQTLLRPLFADLVGLLLQDLDVLDAAQQSERLRSVVQAIELTHQAEMQDYLGERCAVETIRSDAASAPAPGVAVLYTIILPERLELILRTRDGLRHYAAPIAAAALEEEVTQLRAALLEPSSNAYLARVQRLYDALLRPFEAQLASERVQQLVIVPDRYLRLIPFGVLHDGHAFLAERYVVSSVTGLSMTAAAEARTGRATSLLAGLSEPGPVVSRLIGMGFAPYGVRGGAALTAGVPVRARGASTLDAAAAEPGEEAALRSELRLPAVETEIAQLEHFGRTEPLLNQDFTVARFEREVRTGRYRIIHIATHGFFGDSAQQSFLLAFDDVIHMDDLQSLIADPGDERAGIELLTLSACDTATGDDRAPLGFAGAAIKARARSVVGTLWSLSDDAAPQFMLAFYAALNAHGKAQALTQAQRALIRSQRFSHPYYWAPIVLIGDWT